MPLTSQQQATLHKMGIETWAHRSQLLTQEKTKEGVSEAAPSEEWEALRQAVITCEKCELHKTRTHAVFGVGNPKAELFIVGEAPGANEDKQGKPFVGRAGQLLNNMLLSIGLKREEVFIANILKCRPPNNRDPLPEEVAQCTPYIVKQLSIMKPTLILAVGRIAAHFLLQQKTSLSRLRGQQFTYGPHKTPLQITYHPAYLLRNPRDKGKAYSDLLKVAQFLKNNKHEAE